MTADRRLSLILLAVMCISAMLVPVVALAVIPERIVDKVIELPWETIWPVLVPLATTAIAALWSFFTHPVTAPAPPVRVVDSDATTVESVLRPPTIPTRTKRDGFSLLDPLLFVIAIACAASLLHGCGAQTAQVVKTVVDGAQWTCAVVEPICRVADLACGVIAPSTSGGEFEAP